MRFRSAPDAGAQEVRSGSRFDRYSVYCSKDLQIAAHSVDELRSVLYNTIAYIMRYYVDSMYIEKNGRFYGQNALNNSQTGLGQRRNGHIKERNIRIWNG